MSTNLLSIFGYNKADTTEKLIVVWSRAPMIYTSGSWVKAPITLTADQKAEFRTFIDYAFMVNGVDPNYCYDGTTWSSTTNLSDSPPGYFIERYATRLYLLDVTINGTRYYSRVWFSDLPKNNTLTWGLEYGSDLVQTASSKVITSATALFKTRNIKIGDPLFITAGANLGQYTVQSIDSNTQITLTTELTSTVTGAYWVGGNWFDVETDDGDTGKGFGVNSNELLVFKRNSLHRFSSQGNVLRKVKGAVGTTARRSIVNIGDYTYYYHPTGIYRYGGGTTTIISKPVQDFIDNITTANQTEIVGWVAKEKFINFYIGDVTLRDDTAITNCVLSYDTTANQWSARSYPFAIMAATTWMESNIPNVYLGDDSSHVYKIDTGTNFNSSPIPFQVETKAYFPVGSDIFVDFNRLQLFMEKMDSVQVLYKLYYKVDANPNVRKNDKDWKPLKGSQWGDSSIWYFPIGSRACGVAIKIVESSTNESCLIEKMIIYYSNSSAL